MLPGGKDLYEYACRVTARQIWSIVKKRKKKEEERKEKKGREMVLNQKRNDW